MKARTARAVCAGVVGAAAGVAQAQMSLVSQSRSIDLMARYSSASGFEDKPTYSSSAPSGGDWSDSHSVSALNGAAGASGSQSSTISPWLIQGQGSVSAFATTRLVTDTREASAKSHLAVRFSVAIATPVVFDAAIDTASYDPQRGPYQPVTMKLVNVTAGQVMAEVESGWINGPLWEIGDPIHLEAVLAPGQYEIYGEAYQFGFGERPPMNGWSGIGSFHFTMTAVPAPTSSAFVAMAGLVVGRRRGR